MKLSTIQNPPLPNVSVLIFTLYFQLEGMHIKESFLCLLPSNDFLKWFISVTSIHVSKLPWLLSLILWWFQNMKIHMPKLSKMWNGNLLILLLIQWPCLLSSLWAPFFMSLPKTYFDKIFLVFFYHHTSRDWSIPMLCKVADVWPCGDNKIKESIHRKMCICMSYSQYRFLLKHNSKGY